MKTHRGTREQQAQDNEHIKKLYLQGMRIADIVRRTGFAESRVIRVIQRMNGVPTKP